MGWLIALSVLLLLGLMPLGLRAKYDALGLNASLFLGPIKIVLFPRQPKEKKENKETSKKESQSPGKAKKSGGSISDFLPLLQLILDFLHDFRKKLYINHLHLKVIIGGGDPCDLALNYGRGWAALGNILPLLEQVFVVKKRELEVECDFSADQTTVVAGADIVIRLWHLLALLLIHGPKIIKEYLRILKIKKGGVKT